MRFAFVIVFTALLFVGCGRDASPGNDFALPPAATPAYQPATGKEKERQKEPTEAAPVTAESAEPTEADLTAAPLSREDAKKITPANRGKHGPVTAQQAPANQEAKAAPETNTMPVPMVVDVAEIDAVKVFRVYTSPCFGDCKQYELTLYNSGLVVLNGKKNVKREGFYSLELENYQQSKLMELFRAATEEGLFTIYPADEPVPADVPSTVLAYPGSDGKEQTIRVYADAPENLQALLDFVEEMAETASWKAAKG